jgi:hypothetical protein
LSVESSEVCREAEKAVENISCLSSAAKGKGLITGGAAVNDDLVSVGKTAAVNQVVADEAEDNGGVQSALNGCQDTNLCKFETRTACWN